MSKPLPDIDNYQGGDNDPYHYSRDDLTDMPDETMVRQAMEQLETSIETLPADYLTKHMVYVEDFHGPSPKDPYGNPYYDDTPRGGLRDEEKRFIYNMESPRVLGGWSNNGTTLGGLTKKDIDAKIEKLKRVEEIEEWAWETYRIAYPQLASDPQGLMLAVGRLKQDFRNRGIDPATVITNDPNGWVQMVANEHMGQDAYGEPGYRYQEEDTGRTYLPSGSYGSQGPREQGPTDMVEDLRHEQRKSGYY